MSDISPPALKAEQQSKLAELARLALALNSKINLYSEASSRDFWSRHVLHSLTLASKPFPADSCVIDWGTGGGMPGLPLAIVFPDVEFVLVDAVQKKIQAVQTMTRRLQLHNVTAWHGRAEAWEGSATHSVSRATAPLATLWAWHSRIATPPEGIQPDGVWQSGLLCLKGGELKAEIEEMRASDPNAEIVVTPLTRHDERTELIDKVLVEVYRR